MLLSCTRRQWQEALVEDEHLPSTQIIVWRNGHIAYNESTGVRRGSVPVSACCYS